jgi:hypothetical protein
VITPVIVYPGQAHVIGLVPQFIVPQDGHDQQDCENAAAKRWLSQYGSRLSPLNILNITVLGDDLYCHQPLCQQLLDQQLDFILVCRPESHTTVYEHLDGIDLPTSPSNGGLAKLRKPIPTGTSMGYP